jgi:hypothetical protein
MAILGMTPDRQQKPDLRSQADLEPPTRADSVALRASSWFMPPVLRCRALDTYGALRLRVTHAKG